ncbi:DUF7573 domain-containing protein [Halorubellus salinus]|uniref:DUF7573 domain-containing protein n=1 Tax=Halorubellus salinus TaxID=755309 RepID=UPI001D08EEDE|nr:hypothetical protein [Halorubellus salinus]
MTEDASIDEFVDRDAADATDADAADDDAVDERTADADASSDGTESGDGTESTVDERVASASPAASTSRFEPDGAACASCGEVVERLWLADGDDVCEACKPW